jgi:ribosome-binding protein aMBF1 (putative translation factor)
MKHNEVKARLLQDPPTREAYEHPPLALVVARGVVVRRRELGMSQEQVAQALETSQNQVWRIESGQANMTLDTLERLAHVLKVPVSYLVSEVHEELGATLPQPVESPA